MQFLSVARIVSLRSVLRGGHCISVIDGFANNWGVRVNNESWVAEQDLFREGKDIYGLV